MNENEFCKENYRLAARLRGGKLTVVVPVENSLLCEHVRAIRAARKRSGHPDLRAFDESVEWERLGDFRFAVGSLPGAVRAYCEAALCCLDGVQYDYGPDFYPCRRLRMRFFELFDKAVARCGDDPLLLRIVREDRLLCDEYKRFRSA